MIAEGPVGTLGPLLWLVVGAAVGAGELAVGSAKVQPIAAAVAAFGV